MQTLVRKFKLGSLVLDDPSPSSDVDEVRRIHSDNYPQVRHTTIWDQDGVPVELNGEIVLMFHYQLPPIKVNG